MHDLLPFVEEWYRIDCLHQHIQTASLSQVHLLFDRKWKGPSFGRAFFSPPVKDTIRRVFHHHDDVPSPTDSAPNYPAKTVVRE